MRRRKVAYFVAVLAIVGGVGCLLPTSLVWADGETLVSTCEEFLAALEDDNTIL